jgi:hypothetical protein
VKTLLIPLTVLALALTLAGCASLRPLDSAPPVSAIRLSTPLTIKGILGGRTILPSGEYKATMEDDRGYYYNAPAKLIHNDTSSWLMDGGLYVRKGQTTPSHYYLVGRQHIADLYRLKEQAQFELIP